MVMFTMINRVKIYILLILLLISFVSLASKPHVIFISPDPIDTSNVFWSEFIVMMQKSADDLEINLEVVYSNASRFGALEVVENITKRQVLPDAIFLLAHVRVFPKILILTEKSKIYTIVVNSPVDDRDKIRVGKPRGIYKYWLGSLTPNDEHAGYILAKHLFSMAPSILNKPPYFVSGFTGAFDTSVPKNRVKGLHRAVGEFSQNVSFQQVFNGAWNYHNIAEKLPHIMNRYPKTRIFWSAGGGMSLGVIPYVQQQQDKFMIGELEWSTEVFEHMLKGNINAAVGGHFMEGAWAMVMIYDFLQGFDFKDDIGLRSLSNFALVDDKLFQRNSQYYLQKQWRNIDFKHYSKSYSKNVNKYDFVLPEVVPSESENTKIPK